MNPINLNDISPREIIPEFEHVEQGIKALLEEWEIRLKELPEDVISERKNSQGRTIRMILGHLCDSASNNTHRIVHLQYQAGPLIFPNYATHGNNDRWISIQDYQHEGNGYQLPPPSGVAFAGD